MSRKIYTHFLKAFERTPANPPAIQIPGLTDDRIPFYFLPNALQPISLLKYFPEKSMVWRGG